MSTACFSRQPRRVLAIILLAMTFGLPAGAQEPAPAPPSGWGTTAGGKPCYVTPTIAIEYDQILDVLKNENHKLTLTLQSMEKLEADVEDWATAVGNNPVTAADIAKKVQALRTGVYAPLRAMAQQAKTSGNAALAEVYDGASGVISNQIAALEAAGQAATRDGATWSGAKIFLAAAALAPEKQALRTRLQAVGEDGPDYVKQIGEEMNRVRNQYIQWGFRTPPQQTITLVPMSYGGECIFGKMLAEAANLPVEGQATVKGHLHAGVLTDSKNLVPLTQLRHTLAHEYFHRCQMQYYALLPSGAWFREGTAGLLELLMYPDDIKKHVDHSSFKMEIRTTPLEDHADNAAAFFFFLGTKYANTPTDITRSIWEEFLNKTNFKASTAIENVFSGRKQTMRDLFHEFAELYYTSDPRSDPNAWFYAAVRKDHPGEGGQPYKVILEDTVRNAKEEAVATLNLKPFTATYTVYDRGAPTDLEVTVDDAFGVLVRFYAVTPAGTTYVASASGKTTIAAKLPIGGGNKIGVLVSCVAERSVGGMFDRGDFASGVKMTWKEVKQEETKPPVAGAFQDGDAAAIDPRMKRDGDSSQEQILLGESLSGSCWTQSSLYSTNVVVQINKKPDAAAAVDALKRESKTQQEEMDKFVRGGETYNWKTTDKSTFGAAESIRHQVRRHPTEAADPTEEVMESYSIYRDVFVIRVRLTQKMQPESGADGQLKTAPLADFAPQRKALLAKAQELTDKRFPK